MGLLDEITEIYAITEEATSITPQKVMQVSTMMKAQSNWCNGKDSRELQLLQSSPSSSKKSSIEQINHDLCDKFQFEITTLNEFLTNS